MLEQDATVDLFHISIRVDGEHLLESCDECSLKRRHLLGWSTELEA